MEPISPSKSRLEVTGFNGSRKVLKIGVALVVIMLFGVFIVSYMSKTTFFTVVLDCGSSGTRVNVYEWRKGGYLSNSDLPVLIHSYPDDSVKIDGEFSQKGGCFYHCVQTEPGLDKFLGNFSGVRESVEPLIHLAELWVPLERHGETPIFVLATAGLRRLQADDAKKILKDVEDVVTGHGFMFKESWIRVLSGKEEAYYGWVALNYQMGIFGNLSRLHSLGLLDLGGSSLQVVTEVDGPRRNENVLRAKIGSIEHWILAYSLPAFGLNEGFDRTVVMLSHTQALKEGSHGTVEVSHPCLSSGFVKNYTCGGCFRKKVSDIKDFSTLSRENEAHSVILVGDPNWEKCKGLSRAVAVNFSNPDWSHLDNGSVCSLSFINGKDVLYHEGRDHSSARFHALSGFYAVYNILNLSPRANLTKIWEKGQQLCERSWTGSNNYAEQYCFKVPYLASLFEDALCVADKEIIFGPGNISWTLGAGLMEGRELWQSSTYSPIGVLSLGNSRIISSPLLLFVVLSCLLLIVYYSQVKLPMPGRKISAVGSSLPSYIRSRRQPA
ncbi:hypothetical protein DCAR_0730035 [Daucus carota subsp. sativus]|uniref:Apyrase n=2 Tax=Daucus carota subsp. sativus TaxID=79200 RepID=A0AAF1BBV9_DAUCS|nr:PREDICTED: probable apyrase 7 [Daucus carota subsp. sativus]WOH10566.1 hypothetical protein DCAR_0730035 [Daucus carota subsp. sativus]